jgi:aminoglycoside 3-N-acetyltransferase
VTEEGPASASAAPGAGIPTVDGRALADAFRAVGVRAGGTLLVHSSLSSLGRVPGGAATVVDALRAALGDEGTLVVPTLTFDTVCARQPVFHEALTPSVVGRITEELRGRRQAVRSLHPTHSVAALGPGASSLVAGHHLWDTPCAPGSPFGRLVEREAQVLMIGVGLESFTMLHAFEEWAGVPWLFNRTEILYSITRTCEIHRVESRRHTDVPRYEERDFPSLEPVFADAGALAYGRAGAAKLRLVDAARASQAVVPLLQREPDAVLGGRHEERWG